MTVKAPAQKIRGTPVDVPAWWMKAANAEVEKRRKVGKLSMQGLADELTAIADRKLHGKRFGWDRKTVERFLKNEVTTSELVEAFETLFPELIPFVYRAETEEMAVSLFVASRRVLEASEGSGERKNRQQVLVAEREAMERRVRDQARGVDSPDDEVVDEGSKMRRRTRGVARGG